MKNTYFFKPFLVLIVSAVGLFGCGKSSDGSTSTVTTTATYYLSGGVCYNSQTAQTVALSYCGASSGYYLANGYCYSSATGQIVATTYCSSTSTTTPTTSAISQVCVGYYIYYNGYSSQMGYCNGANCRGYTLYQYGTNQAVNCQ